MPKCSFSMWSRPSVGDKAHHWYLVEPANYCTATSSARGRCTSVFLLFYITITRVSTLCRKLRCFVCACSATCCSVDRQTNAKYCSALLAGLGHSPEIASMNKGLPGLFPTIWPVFPFPRQPCHRATSRIASCPYFYETQRRLPRPSV